MTVIETAREAPTARAVMLESIFLHVTKACNLNCAYCYFSARKPLPDEMSTAELVALWPDLVALGPTKVVFTGGEPLLRSDLVELLQELRAVDRNHRVKRCLNSNGRLVTRGIATALVGLADEVRISLDGPALANDGLRGAGTFAAAMRALHIYQDVGFEPKVLVTVTSHTLPYLEEFISMLVQQGFMRISLNPFRPIGRGKGHDEWRVDWREVGSVIERVWARRFPNAAERPLAPVGETQSTCGVGRFLNIMPNGDVFPCHVLTQPEFRAGSARYERLGQICRRNGLVGKLAGIDFSDLVRDDPVLAPLTRRGACMGDVYRATKDSSAWDGISGTRSHSS